MTRIIFEHRGTIDKYVGDMVMAFWGAPVRDPDHAAHAIEAALAMLAGTETLKREFVRLGLPEISIGIGINSGVMNVGDMGSEYRRSYTVLGDAVNLASRLEGTTKYYGVGLVVGERTRDLAGDRFVWRELDLVRVKGKDRPVRVYEPVCRRDEADPGLLDELRRHDAALAAFRARRWDEAVGQFSALHTERPGFGLYALYLERMAGQHADSMLPPDWDGSWTRTEK
jgi:adenylate cyclase